MLQSDVLGEKTFLDSCCNFSGSRRETERRNSCRRFIGISKIDTFVKLRLIQKLSLAYPAHQNSDDAIPLARRHPPESWGWNAATAPRAPGPLFERSTRHHGTTALRCWRPSTRRRTVFQGTDRALSRHPLWVARRTFPRGGSATYPEFRDSLPVFPGNGLDGGLARRPRHGQAEKSSSAKGTDAERLP